MSTWSLGALDVSLSQDNVHGLSCGRPVPKNHALIVNPPESAPKRVGPNPEVLVWVERLDGYRRLCF